MPIPLRAFFVPNSLTAYGARVKSSARSAHYLKEPNQEQRRSAKCEVRSAKCDVRCAMCDVR